MKREGNQGVVAAAAAANAAAAAFVVVVVVVVVVVATAAARDRGPREGLGRDLVAPQVSYTAEYIRGAQYCRLSCYVSSSVAIRLEYCSASSARA